MSEQHTPEPWRQTATGLSISDGVADPNAGFPHGRQIATISLNHAPAERLANARRIVACVNALTGVPTEYLEKLTPGTLADVIEVIIQKTT